VAWFAGQESWLPKLRSCRLWLSICGAPPQLLGVSAQRFDQNAGDAPALRAVSLVAVKGSLRNSIDNRLEHHDREG
jgi:hypothetical protein